MYPTDPYYLFNIAEEMQFPAARCAQGDSICMYGKSASSGVPLKDKIWIWQNEFQLQIK
jgi:hypothetical protein